VTCVRLANPPGAWGGKQEKATLTRSGHALSVALQTLAAGLRPVRPQRKMLAPAENGFQCSGFGIRRAAASTGVDKTFHPSL